jgi:hypothetical protein
MLSKVEAPTLKGSIFISHPSEILPPKREFHGAGRVPRAADPPASPERAGSRWRAGNLIRQDKQDFRDLKFPKGRWLERFHLTEIWSLGKYFLDTGFDLRNTQISRILLPLIEPSEK